MCKMIVKFLKSKVFHHWQKFQHKSIKKVYMYGNQTQKQNSSNSSLISSMQANKQRTNYKTNKNLYVQAQLNAVRQIDGSCKILKTLKYLPKTSFNMNIMELWIYVYCPIFAFFLKFDLKVL